MVVVSMMMKGLIPMDVVFSTVCVCVCVCVCVRACVCACVCEKGGIQLVTQVSYSSEGDN